MIDECSRPKSHDTCYIRGWCRPTHYLSGVASFCYIKWLEHIMGADIVGIIMSYGINRPEYTMPILKHHENLR